MAITNPFGELSLHWNLRGIAFAGRVDITTANVYARLIEVRFIDCALESGLQHVYSDDPYDIEILSFSNCRLLGKCEARASSVYMQSDTIGVGVRWGVVDTLRVQHCWFTGGPGRALDIVGDGLAGVISDNLLEDYATGIYGYDLDQFVVASNTVRRMTDIGMDFLSGYAATLSDNAVEDCGAGIRSQWNEAEVHNNTILRCGGTGMWFMQPDYLRAEGNIVAHCGGTAITVLESWRANLLFIRNTLFGNAGSGIDLALSTESVVLAQSDIAMANTGWGLLIPKVQASVTLDCNDWYVNSLGSVAGTTVGPDDFSVDPLFCDAANDDVSLFSRSPLVTQGACGQIGARGVGCSVTATVLTRLVATAEGGRIAVQWGYGASDHATGWIERSTQDAGPWDSLGTGSHVSGSEYVLYDADVQPGQVYLYRVAWTERGITVYSAPVTAELSGAELGTSLMPNPSFGDLDLEWTLTTSSEVDVRVYDLAGREVALLTKGRLGPGRHRIHWNCHKATGAATPAGWYVVRMRNGGVNSSHRFLLIR